MNGREPLIEARDPQAIKRERAALRSELIALIEARLGTRRCKRHWWDSHDYGNRSSITPHSSDAGTVTRCEACDTPCSWDAFNAYDLLCFAEGRRGGWRYVTHKDKDQLATDEELDPFYDRWRALNAV